MSAPGLAPRQAAVFLLGDVLENGHMLSEASLTGKFADLPGPARARAMSTATGVLRHLEPIDVVLSQFLNKPPQTGVLNALRLMTFELLVDGIPPHAAVDAAVRQVRASRKISHLGKLVNAVGRNVVREGAEIWPDLPPQTLPDWIAGATRRIFGEDATTEIEAAHARGAALDVTLKCGKADDWATKLDAVALPNGSLRLLRPQQVSTMPGFEGGDWWVQDAAATLPALLLGNVKGARILDLCAAPGGKTLQLAAAGGQVTALDISAKRLCRLEENLKRTNLSAEVVAADALTWAPDAPFDAILLDAPCSATGTIRRHPELPFIRTGEDVPPLVKLQADLISRAADWLVPGGRMVFSTCSLLPAEGEKQIAKLAATAPSLRHVPADLPDGYPVEALREDGTLRLRPDFWPDRGGMDGFFAAVLERH